MNYVSEVVVTTIAPNGSAALPFVIPERTRISCHSAQDRVTCAPFSKERRMKFEVHRITILGRWLTARGNVWVRSVSLARCYSFSL